MDIFREVEDYMDSGLRINRIDPLIRYAAAMRFYATGSYQRSIGEEYLNSMSQKSISNCIAELTVVLQRTICAKYIVFPKTEPEKNKIKERFFLKTGFPGVLGCIDGTHVNLLTPSEDEHLFLDRKGNHSLNVQLVKRI